MKLVHFSDFHLGFRSYQRLTPAGINQREADVAATFHRAIDQIISIKPNLVVIGGDVFHTVRPGNAAIVATFSEFMRLVTSLPECAIVLVAGNHDMPKVSDGGCILPLYRNLGIHVVDREHRRIDLPHLELSVLGVPDAPGLTRPPLEPNPAARYNVLVMHGEIEGTLTAGAKSDRPSVEIPTSEIGLDRWDYVALGHYHVYREIAPNCYYSGSIDYTSTDIWGEVREEATLGIAGKGLIERDLETGAHTFHHITPSRAVVELPTIDGSGMTCEELDAAIAASLDACPGGIDGAIARLLVHSVPKTVSHAINHKMVRSYKARALNFQLDMRAPDVVRLGSIIGPMLMRGQPLEDIVRARMASRELSPGVDRAALMDRAFGYLDEARERVSEQISTPEPLSMLEAAS